MVHTAKQMHPTIGQVIRVRFEQITVECAVSDVKSAWGKMRLQVEPVSGEGEQWIELERVVD